MSNWQYALYSRCLVRTIDLTLWCVFIDILQILVIKQRRFLVVVDSCWIISWNKLVVAIVLRTVTPGKLPWNHFHKVRNMRHMRSC